MATSLPQSAHLIARWSADDITPQSDNTNLSSWTDGVGGFAATQATSGNQPKYRTNRIGSKPSVQFTASSQHMLQIGRPAAIVNALNATTATILIIFKSLGNDTGALLDLGNDGTGAMIQTTGTTVGRFAESYSGSIPFAGQTSFSTLGMTVGSYTNGAGTWNLEQWFINGSCVGHSGAAATGPGASGHLAIGGDYTNAAFFNATFEVFDILFWDSKLTPTEMLQAEMWACEKYSQAYPWAANDHFVIFDGDSITMGIGGSNPGDSYPYKAAQSLGLSYGQWSNVGIGGDTITEMDARAGTCIDDVYALIGKPIKLSCFEWYNQRAASPGPRNNSLTYIGNRRSSTTKVVFGTSTDTSVTTDTDRADYNSYFDSNHSTATMDAYVAIHNDAQIGVETAAASNPGNFSDGVHLTGAGYTYLAALFVSGLQSVAFAPIINAQPSNQYVALGQYATFSVTATASDGGGLTYQWQTNSSGSFADITGETSSTLTIAGSYLNTGWAYRCVVTDGSGSTTTSAAVISVTSRIDWPAWLLPEAAIDGQAMLSVSGWAGADYRIEKWVADELGLAAGGGPTDYPVSITEAGTASTTQAAALASSAARTEAATAADAATATLAGTAATTEAATASQTSAAVLAATASQVDAATATETAAASATGDYNAGITESATAAEAQAGALAATAAATEAAAAAQTSAATLASTAAAAEGATAADAAAASLAATASTTEAATASEASTGTPAGVYVAGITEVATASDAAAAVGAFTATRAEAATAAEAAQATVPTFADCLETATPIDISAATAGAVAPAVLSAPPAGHRVQTSARTARTQTVARPSRSQTRTR